MPCHSMAEMKGENMEFFKDYLSALDHAVKESTKYQLDYGIRRTRWFNRDGFKVFMLSKESHTFGDDLMAERVKPNSPKVTPFK
jgi:hypothetical protein